MNNYYLIVTSNGKMELLDECSADTFEEAQMVFAERDWVYGEVVTESVYNLFLSINKML